MSKNPGKLFCSRDANGLNIKYRVARSLLSKNAKICFKKGKMVSFYYINFYRL